MNHVLEELCLKVKSPLVAEGAMNFRPLTWPPARDWPVVVDKEGAVVSRWGDHVWDLTPLTNYSTKLNFGDAPKERNSPIDRENADLLRLVMTWLMWGPRAYPSIGTIKNRFGVVRVVFALCSSNRINAVSLLRFPRVLEQLPARIAPSKWAETLNLFHRLYDAREVLGFTILDPAALQRLAEVAAYHENVQTPYIPPRIWTYQVTRLRECLDDFRMHRDQLERCFSYCLEAYVTNFGSLQAALQQKKDSTRGPFSKSSASKPSCKYLGPFGKTADSFGIHGLLRKWVTGWKHTRVTMLSSYLSLVSIAALAYVANFTLQRKEEVASLRCTCPEWEEDEKFGRILVICGETTKTIADSDARWIASPSVELAVAVLRDIATWRMRCDAVNPTIHPSPEDIADPYVASTPTEPWGTGVGRARPYNVRLPLDDLNQVIEYYPNLLDIEQLKITEEDLQIALKLTPNLPANEFHVGAVWPLAWHQFRRTAAVNMFASGVVSHSTMQYEMKHSNRLMPLLYGRGHTRLRLNEEVESAVVKAMYEAMAHRLKSAVSDRFVSPYGEERKQAKLVNILDAKDVKALSRWAREGTVSFRENRLGGCMKPGPCEYGGIESIARCGGGDGGKPCTDVMFDREKACDIAHQLVAVTARLKDISPEAPQRRALDAERQAMENYLNVISS